MSYNSTLQYENLFVGGPPARFEMVYNFQKVPPVVGTLVGAIRWGPLKLLNFQVSLKNSSSIVLF